MLFTSNFVTKDLLFNNYMISMHECHNVIVCNIMGYQVLPKGQKIDVLFFLFQLLDVFGHKSNVSLVFDFMETDLEVST